jgi:hypothetical protein
VQSHSTPTLYTLQRCRYVQENTNPMAAKIKRESWRKYLVLVPTEICEILASSVFERVRTFFSPWHLYCNFARVAEDLDGLKKLVGPVPELDLNLLKKGARK